MRKRRVGSLETIAFNPYAFVRETSEVIVTGKEVELLQAHLRRLFGCTEIAIVSPKRKGATVEIAVNGEFVGTVHRDEDDGEVVYHLSIYVLAEDLGSSATTG